MIKYDKMFEQLRENGYNTNRIRKEKLISEGTLQAIRTGKGGLSHKTINAVCSVLRCQPGDIMEWIPDEPTEEIQENKDLVES